MATVTPSRPRRRQAARSPIRRRQPRQWGRVRRVALLASLMALVGPLVSYAGVLTQTSDSSLGIRTVEWMRDHGARGLVNEIENLYYTLNAPATGGPALHALPRQPGTGSAGPASRSHAAVAYRPAPIPPVIHPARRQRSDGGLTGR